VPWGDYAIFSPDFFTTFPPSRRNGSSARAPNGPVSYERTERIETMDGKDRVKAKAVVADFLELGANAFVGGIMVAIALAVITLALATSAQAAPIETGSPHKTACLEVATPQEPRSAALTPDEEPSGVGALWANLLMGSVALSSAGIVAFLGRTIPAGRPGKHPAA
jgi:hypothetical protein